MDIMVGAQATIPAKLKIEAVQYMVKHAVDDKSQEYPRGDAQYVMRLELRSQIPEATEYGRDHEPRHGNQSFSRLVVHHVTCMSRRATFMINPAVKGVFDERPGRQPGRKGECHQPWPAAQHEQFPKNEEDNRQRVADEGDPIICRAEAEPGDALMWGILHRRSKVVECHLNKVHLAGGET